MTKTLERIEDDVFEASNDGQMPYITLQAFRLGIEAVRQLTRIADALQLTAPPDLRTLTANSLPDVPHRNEVTGHPAPIDEQSSEVSAKLHACARDIIPVNRTLEICDACHYNEHCNDRIPL